MLCYFVNDVRFCSFVLFKDGKITRDTAPLNMVLTFEPVDAIQMKATEWYFPIFPMVLFFKVVLTFQYVDEILKAVLTSESADKS